MKTRVTVAALGLAGAITLGSFLSAAGERPQNSEMKELKRRMAELEERLSKMEEKMNTAPPVITWQPGSPPALPKTPNEQRPPRVWGEGEVNGWKFYLIPLKTDAPGK